MTFANDKLPDAMASANMQTQLRQQLSLTATAW
jgi:hypothetical protein